MTSDELTGTTAVVTGASRGFGRAIAVAFCQAGARVVGVAQHEPGLDELSAQLGEAFVPITGDAADPDLPRELIARFKPRTVVLNAGAAPRTSPLGEQTWETFSRNWDVDVRQVFHFLKESLAAPLEPGSVVVSFSSGAALRGSPLSGGYAGAKATIKFISAYADREARERELGIRFVSVLPQLTPATALGAGGVEAYAAASGLSTDEFISRMGPTLTTEQVAKSLLSIVTNGSVDVLAYILTAEGAKALDQKERQ